MISKEKLLIINANQFGYSSGYHYYCRYLKKDFEIDFLCFDKGLAKVVEPWVNIVYRDFNQNKIGRLIGFVRCAIRLSRQKDYDAILCVYFKLAFLVGIMAKGQLRILDIRTGSLSDNKFNRWFHNRMILFSSLFFHKITILSKRLANLLKLPSRKTTILPLGADILARSPKVYDKMHLIYIGILYKRNIERTIEGFSRFYEKYSGKLSIHYDIIGFGRPEDEKKIRNAIENHNMEGVVVFHGRKNHHELKPYLQNATVGICFIPRTRYYDVQPPTKIVEYAFSGLITIATDTLENRDFINDENGLLCRDNAGSFCDALEEIFSRLEHYDEYRIRTSLSDFSWQRIIANVLVNVLRD